MASPEHLQHDMFSGKWVDNRTPTQKDRDRVLAQPQQTLMFSQREMAQFGVNPRPLFSLSPHTKLVLIAEDPRTDEERERDLMREAERLTQPLFPSPIEEVEPSTQLSLPAVDDGKEAAYRQIIGAVEQHTRMQRSPTGSTLKNLIRFAAVREEAERVGLTSAEFWMAVQIGAYRGGAHTSPPSKNIHSPEVMVFEASWRPRFRRSPHVGYRLRSRRGQ